jgi:hypothetical protein
VAFSMRERAVGDLISARPVLALDGEGQRGISFNQRVEASSILRVTQITSLLEVNLVKIRAELFRQFTAQC